jgi:ankyrin repeat protein
MPHRYLPVRPNLDQLRNQAKDFLRLLHREDPQAVEEFREHHPAPPPPVAAKLGDAQLALARSYKTASWPRLVTACKLTDAIWRGDVETVRQMVIKSPELLTENARGVPDSNWGPPMSYAANVGQNEIIQALRDLGAQDLNHAFDRACLQGRIGTARLLHKLGAVPGEDCLLWTCETQNPDGMAFLMELGLPFQDKSGDWKPLVALLLETYGRNPSGKHACLRIAVAQGIELPDTPVMALHLGRVDLLDAHLKRDPQLLSRQFSYRDIYPLELGCHEDESLGLHGTPLDGGTLLHLAVDFDEPEIVDWFLQNGGDVDAPAAIMSDGFGGHTALFGCVVSQPYRCGRQRGAPMTTTLLAAGANPGARASLKKRLRFVEDETEHEYRDVSVVEWGERFHDQDWVNRAALLQIRSALER